MNRRFFSLASGLLPFCAVTLVQFFPSLSHAAEGGADLAAIKQYLVQKAHVMDGAAHDFAKRAADYAAIIKKYDGDYNAAAKAESATLLPLIVEMQNDYRVYHNNGYEAIEGITAGVRRFVEYDNYLDAGVPKSEASTDSPASALVLKTAEGKTIVNQQGNLFHYVIEPMLWGTTEQFIKRLDSEASTAAKGVKALPRAEVVLAASKELVAQLDTLSAKSEAWQPTLDECVGALVWMTPTLNGYFDDWRDSRYNPTRGLTRYVAQSRVIDMRGIMGSLQLTYNAVLPALSQKDPALAKQIAANYKKIMDFIAGIETREKKGKISVLEIEELSYQAKALTDQLGPELKQAVALLDVKLPRKPILI